MITNRTDEADLEAKQEKQKADGGVYSRTLPSSSRQWPTFRNPRIVRVSRSFGGKDRHSKVCTIRGLRDRRIRLSVPTAVQLYDLQDKLGLSQPSKVIDWLLDATKQDIDKLPPLQMPQGFSQFHPHMFGDATTGLRNAGNLLIPDESLTSQFSLSPFFPMNRGIKINDSVNEEGNEAARASSSKYNWDINLGLRAEDNELLHIEKGKSIEMNQLQKQVGIGSHYAQASAPNFSPIVSYYPSFPSGSANNAVPYSYSQWDPSNLSLSQLGGLQVQPQIENFLHSNSVSLPLPSSPPALQLGSQLYPGPLTMPSLFPSYPPYLAASTENDLRRINRSKFLHPQYHSQSQDDEQAK